MEEVLEKIVDEWERLQALNEKSERSPGPSIPPSFIPPTDKGPSEDSSPSPSPKPGELLASLTPEELDRIKRQSLLRQYGYVEGDPEMDVGAGLDRPMREGMTGEEKKAEEERRRRVMEAVKMDGRRKKFRKQQEGERFFFRPGKLESGNTAGKE